MAGKKNDHEIEGSIHERMKEHKKKSGKKHEGKKHEPKKEMKHEGGKKHEVHHYHHVVKGGKKGK